MSENFTFFTTAEEVADVFANRIRGKNVLITGTSLQGIGFEAARVIAKYANMVIIAGYSAERLQLSSDAIKRELPSANIRQLVLDLSSLAAVRKAAEEVNAYPEPLHVLINNAAAAVVFSEVTVDNLERQMATGHIGPFLLTNLLAAKLIASSSHSTAATTEEQHLPRVVFVTSDSHAHCKAIDFTSFAQPIPGKYGSAFEYYYEMKSAVILTAIEMARRAKGKMEVFSLHPGLIYTPLAQKPESQAELVAVGLFDENYTPSAKLEWKTLGQGAATTVTAAFDPSLSDKSGAYLINCKDASDEIAPHASDLLNASRVWEVTEGIVGQSFEL